MKTGYVYILASGRNGTLYIGVSSDLSSRILQHKTKYNINSFTSRYTADKLVYYECLPDIDSAIRREKQLKDWNRNWKKDLIEKTNPEWRDLYDDIRGFCPSCKEISRAMREVK